VPVVGVPIDILQERLGVEIESDRLIEHLQGLGCDVEGFTVVRRHRCERCGNILESTASEEDPVACERCGTDFRESPESLSALGDAEVIRMELLADRPDIFDPAGLARALRGYLGLEGGAPDYELAPPRLSVSVDPALCLPDSERPFIACAVIRGMRLGDDRVKVLMKLQENLHWAMGRDRKRASIGVYDLSTLGGERFQYRAVGPEELRFVPLGFRPGVEEDELTPREILERHPKGRAYAHLLAGWPRLPLLEDGEGQVMALIPVINSEATRVRPETVDLFIDVTGTEERLVGRALNVLVTSLLELAPEARGEQVLIAGPSGQSATPDLSRQTVRMERGGASRLLGAPLRPEEEPGLLERMGHHVSQEGETLLVQVPAWRNDVLHPHDLIEDVAIAYGYNNLEQVELPAPRPGRARDVEVLTAAAREALRGLGYMEVMTLPLVSEETAYDALRLPRDEGRVVIGNPISSEQTMVRTGLASGLLATFSVNASHEMPQRVFEVGRVSLLTEDVETGAEERHHAAAGLIGPQAGFADARSVAEALLAELGWGIQVSADERGLYLPGRGAVLLARRGDEAREVGAMGEVHPEVLERFRLVHPAALVEIDLTALTGLA
jgi:phenylalanyl-tRNA synthetase beta chain